MTCASCKYFDPPQPAKTHGWCQYARLGANVRDWTNKPMQPEGSCHKYKAAGLSFSSGIREGKS